jgi:hypothetical protein
MAALIFLFTQLPLGAAIEIGGDESCQLTLSLLCAKGFPLYKVVWYNQPPLLPILLGHLFKIFGPSLITARLLAVFFGLLFSLAFWLILQKQFGQLIALYGLVFLISSPEVLALSVSVMQEVPAVATGIVSIWFLHQWPDIGKKRVNCLVASGLLMGAALLIKLTAGIMIPAMVLFIGLMTTSVGDRNVIEQIAFNLALWGSATCGSFLLGIMLLGNGDYHVLWTMHFSPEVSRLASLSNHIFSPGIVFRQYSDGLAAAGIGLVLVLWRRDWRQMVLPIALLVTVVAVHIWHRPWWYYYAIHFAVPFSWLAAYGLTTLIRSVWLGPPQGSQGWHFRQLWPIVLAAVLISLLLVNGGERLADNIQSIRQRPRVADSQLIAKMLEYGKFTHWAYARPDIYAFQARLLQPPEIAVLPRNRFWSGQITEEQVLSYVKHYEPEQLLLPNLPMDEAWKSFVEANYTLAYQDTQHLLYVANSIFKSGG